MVSSPVSQCKVLTSGPDGLGSERLLYSARGQRIDVTVAYLLDTYPGNAGRVFPVLTILSPEDPPP